MLNGFAEHHFGRSRSFSEMFITLNRTIYFDQILHTYIFFKINREITKKKNSHAWIRTTVCQAAGLQESLLDNSATMFDIITVPEIALILKKKHKQMYFNFVSFNCITRNKFTFDS